MVQYEELRKLDNQELLAHTVRINAQFSTLARARRAVDRVSDLARTAYVVGQPLSGEPQLPLFDRINWRRLLQIGLALGAAGAVLFVVSNNIVQAQGDRGWAGPLRDLMVIGFLVTGLLSAVGWVGDLIYRVYGVLTGIRSHTLRAVIPERSLQQAEQILFDAGAQAVWVLAGDAELPGEFR
jgi:hypothetical protein